MLGTFIYSVLDVGLNVTLWTAKTTFNGIYGTYNYITGSNKYKLQSELEMYKVDEESYLREFRRDLANTRKELLFEIRCKRNMDDNRCRRNSI